MLVLFWGLILLCFAFIFHLVIWKVYLPKNQVKALLLVFLGTLGLGIITNISMDYFNFGQLTLKDLPGYLHVCLFFISLTLAYIVTYPAIEADSPSLVIVKNIARGGSGGFERERLYQVLTDELLIKPRIIDLLAGNLIYLEGSKYKLTTKGTWFIRILIFYRKLLKADKGG